MNSKKFHIIFSKKDKNSKIQFLLKLINQMCIDARFIRESDHHGFLTFQIIERINRIIGYIDLLFINDDIYEEINFINLVEKCILNNDNPTLHKLYQDI